MKNYKMIGMILALSVLPLQSHANAAVEADCSGQYVTGSIANQSHVDFSVSGTNTVNAAIPGKNLLVSVSLQNSAGDVYASINSQQDESSAPSPLASALSAFNSKGEVSIALWNYGEDGAMVTVTCKKK